MSEEFQEGHTNAHLQEKAQRVADFLEALTLEERAVVLERVGLIWNQQRVDRSENQDRRAEQSTSDKNIRDENEQILACLQLIRIYGHLSRSGRQTLMELAHEMDETERFERLLNEADLNEDT